jgi:hypothetical protein
VNTSLEHLPEHKQKQLTEIMEIIVKAVDPEKAILFGSHATDRWVLYGSRHNLLIERVSKLQAIAEKLCQEKSASFDKAVRAE